MKNFLIKHENDTIGVLSGFDRLVFRGTYRFLCTVAGMMTYLWHASVLLKDFGQHAEAMTFKLKEASLAAATKFRRPIIYLPSASIRKEDKAREVLKNNPVDSGLICVLTSVEPCMSFEVHRNKELKKLELRPRTRKCLHFYHYFLHPEFGLCHARIQTWFPFSIQICLNGREWLARKMDAIGLSYDRHDNCFPWIENFEKAQKLMDEMLTTCWSDVLDGFAQILNPAADTMFSGFPLSYYWSAHQTEWATDVAFRSPKAIASIYPQLAWGAITNFTSPDVLRFLGRNFNCRFSGEVTSDFKNRPEGIRVKHWANGNSLKMYDKGPNILRIETTINESREFKVYRTSENDPDGDKKWLPMRKGVADLQRRTVVSQKANERYLDALAELDSSIRLDELLGPVTKPRTINHKRIRGLHPWTQEDRKLLEAIMKPEFDLAGFRNRDLAKILFPKNQKTLSDKRRASARVSYRLGILRGHGLIVKLTKTRRYRVSKKGRQVCTAAITTQNVTIQQLTRAAA